MNIFKMRRAGPLSTWAPDPARRILKMFISKKTKEGGDPLFTEEEDRSGTTLCSDLGNHHFQNAARGPLKYGAPGPARRILKMMISKKTKGGGDPLFT